MPNKNNVREERDSGRHPRKGVLEGEAVRGRELWEEKHNQAVNLKDCPKRLVSPARPNV